MDKFNLCESEYRFASIVWENEPLGSGKLVELCSEKLGWKKSTTYTVLKKLCQKEILQNENSIVTSVVKKEQIQKFESEQFLEKNFGGSLPKFITSFMSDKKLSKDDADYLKKLIDNYKEE
ncbi:BlaI/MecI/CopY family transcriptional regulator [Clostridium scatologenes]|uniref:Transcriptional repressor, CopY family n=1 Tax=Clostridium scatologenes TaxID=1548 RepID=A0A0E3K057_CLOSL|nr:BlaI/MecI/CopY family transcriptional regulator [Clostridium scatologenes]AKA68870.1 transcriptional repressor, CopY family [Clostridium scatologenes]